jgi:mannose-6-phosphate isomerase class I
MLYPVQLIPDYRAYVWGGHRLRPGPERTAEAWVVYERDRIAAGPLAGRTLAQVVAENDVLTWCSFPRLVARTG